MVRDAQPRTLLERMGRIDIRRIDLPKRQRNHRKSIGRLYQGSAGALASIGCAEVAGRRREQAGL